MWGGGDGGAIIGEAGEEDLAFVESAAAICLVMRCSSSPKSAFADFRSGAHSNCDVLGWNSGKGVSVGSESG